MNMLKIEENVSEKKRFWYNLEQLQDPSREKKTEKKKKITNTLRREGGGGEGD